jgi:hypothetical protein
MARRRQLFGKQRHAVGPLEHPLAAVETVERQASHMRSASPLRRAISIPMRRNEVLHDSPLEQVGFEPSVSQ